MNLIGKKEKLMQDLGFVNPEYGAIKDIINFVSNTSKTCSTCQ